MKRFVRALGTTLVFGAAAGCALVAGIEDFHGVAPDAGDEAGMPLGDAAVVLDDGASATGDANGDAFAGDGQTDADANAASVDASSDATVVIPGCGGACSATQTCVQGTCYPQAVATGRSSPSTLVVVGTALDWVESNLSDTVVSCPATGCTANPDVLASNLTSAFLRRASPQGMPTLIQRDQGAALAQGITTGNALVNLATDDHVVGAAAGQGVLWGSRDKVRFCPGTFGCASPVVLAQNTIPPTGTAMELFGTQAFWTPPNAGIVGCDVTACNGKTSMFAPNTVVDFEVDANGIVSLTSSQVIVATGSANALGTLSISGGVAMVMDATTAYVAANGAIYSIDRASPSLVTRWPAKKPAGLAMDSTFLYWTDGSSVLRAPK